MSIWQDGPKLLHTGPATWPGVTNAVPDANQIYLALQGIDGYIPYVGSNYILVDAVGTDATENGVNLKAALADCYNLTPNGDALANSNRGVLFLFPGYYYLDTVGIELSEFIDIIGIGNPADIIIDSEDPAGTIQIQSTNNYQLKNLTIVNSSFGANGISIDGADNGIWDNLILQSPTSESVEYNGTYTNLECQSNYVLQGDILGTVSDCSFQQYCCGYAFTGDILISGTINNCTSNGNSFGCAQNNVTITGTITNCVANGGFCFGAATNGTANVIGRIENCYTPINFGNSFCYSNLGDAELSGSIINCVSDANAFVRSSTGSTITSTGLIRSCTIIGTIGQSFCFASDGSATMEGIIDSCMSKQTTEKCFVCTDTTGGDATLSGTIKNCSFPNGSNAFVCVLNAGQIATITTTGIIDNCDSDTNSFCYGVSSKACDGWINNSRGSTNCFGDTSASGRISNCKRFANYGNHAGIIEYCYFFDLSDVAAIYVSAGAVIRYSILIAQGGSYSITSLSPGTGISFYQCSMNLVEDVTTITNFIVTPYNVVDAAITI